MPQRPGPRKPLRLGLWGPFVIAGIAVMGWSLAWGLTAREVDRRLDAGVNALAAQGVAVEWSGKRLYGYPFRLNLDLSDLRVVTGETSIRFARLETQAFLHAPRSWLAAAPEGLTFQRPQGGSLDIEGQRLLASLVLPKSGPPRLSFEGLKLAFSPAPGARPFALASAGRLELHLRPGPNDQAAVFLRLEDATPTPGRLFADLGGGGAVSAAVDARLDHASALRGEGLSRALSTWGAAGGRLELREAGLTAGEARLSLASPGLKAGPEGRLEGRLTVTAAKAPSLLVALSRHRVLSPVEAAGGMATVLMGRSGGDDVRLDLDLSGGQVRLVR